MNINCGSIADGEQASQRIFDTFLVLASGKLTPAKLTASAKKRSSNPGRADAQGTNAGRQVGGFRVVL
jgi:hypothetical protein